MVRRKNRSSDRNDTQLKSVLNRGVALRTCAASGANNWDRARQLYKNISMLFLFPVKDGKLSTGVIAIFNASCYGIVFNNLKLPYKTIV